MKTKITVIVADDHALIRNGLSSLIGAISEMEMAGEARNGEEAVRLAAKIRPDVVVMDLMMPKMDGVAATAAISERSPDTKVVVLTSINASDMIVRALDAGAFGAVTKDAPNEELIGAIRAAARGERTISDEVKRVIAEDPPVPKLSPRQAEILEFLTRGLTNQDISRLLKITEDCVEQHIKVLLSKLDAANRTEAVAIALRKHLLKL